MILDRVSLVARTIKNQPTRQETGDQSLGWEDPLEKEMATNSTILAWRIPWTEEPGRLQFMGSKRVRYNWGTNTFTFKPLYSWFFMSHSLVVVKGLAWLNDAYESCHAGPPKTDRSWWRVLTKRSPSEEGMANHSSILASRTPRTVWKGKKIWPWKMSTYPRPQVCRCPICHWGRAEGSY